MFFVCAGGTESILNNEVNRPKLTSLELGRGIAALLVVLFHFPGYSLKYFGDYGQLEWFRGGQAGVEYFFVLSGFIIYWIHKKDIGTQGSATIFAKKRFVRLYPIYWLIVIPVALMMYFVTGLGDEKELTILRIVKDTLLIPRPGDLVIPPAWTLHRELIFYALFLFGLYKPRIGFTTLFLWQLTCLGYAVLPVPNVPNYYFFVVFGWQNLGFGLGLIAAWISFKNVVNLKMAFGLFVVGASAFLALVFAQGYLEITQGQAGFKVVKFGRIWSAGYLLSSFVLVLGVVALERYNKIALPKWIVNFGGASYVLYLMHEPAGSVFYKIFTLDILREYFNHYSAFYLAVLGVVISSVIVHLYIEKPLLAYGRKKIL